MSLPGLDCGLAPLRSGQPIPIDWVKNRSSQLLIGDCLTAWQHKVDQEDVTNLPHCLLPTHQRVKDSFVERAQCTVRPLQEHKNIVFE